jgi:hypothetical protein
MVRHLRRLRHFTTTNAWTPPGGVYGSDLPEGAALEILVGRTDGARNSF